MKRVRVAIAVSVMIGATISAAHALSGANLSGANGISVYAAHKLVICLGSIRVEHVQLAK
jgi:hypothetical protein